MTATQIACLIVVAIAAAIDMRTMKIPNLLTFPAAALGILMSYLSHGARGAIWAAAGWLVGAAVVSATKLCLRQVGYGDVKLIAAVGAFLGPALVLLTYFYFCLCFGVYAFARVAVCVPWQAIVIGLLAGRVGPLPLEKLATTLKAPVPLGPAIAAGTLLAILLERQTMQFLGFVK